MPTFMLGEVVPMKFRITTSGKTTGRNDHIWLPNGAARLIRGEMLMDDADVFLTH